MVLDFWYRKLESSAVISLWTKCRRPRSISDFIGVSEKRTYTHISLQTNRARQGATEKLDQFYIASPWQKKIHLNWHVSVQWSILPSSEKFSNLEKFGGKLIVQLQMKFFFFWVNNFFLSVHRIFIFNSRKKYLFTWNN